MALSHFGSDHLAADHFASQHFRPLLEVAAEDGRLNPAYLERIRAEKRRTELLPPLKSRPDIPIALQILDRTPTIAEISSEIQTKRIAKESEQATSGAIDISKPVFDVESLVSEFLNDPIITPKLELFTNTIKRDGGIILPSPSELEALGLESQQQEDLKAILLILMALEDD